MAMEIKRFNKDKENIVGFLFNNDIYTIDGRVCSYIKISDESRTRVNPKIKAQMEKIYKNLIKLEKLKEKQRKLEHEFRNIRKNENSDIEKLQKIYEKEIGLINSLSLLKKIRDLFEDTNLKEAVSNKVKDGISSGHVNYSIWRDSLNVYVPLTTIRHPKEGDFGCLYREYDGSLFAYDINNKGVKRLTEKAQFTKWKTFDDFKKMFDVKDRRIKVHFDAGVSIGDKNADFYFSVSYILTKDTFKKEEVKEILKKFTSITKNL